MTEEEYKRGLAYLNRVARTEDGAKALHFVVAQLPLWDANFSGEAYADAFINGKRSVALQLRSFLGDEMFIRILQAKV